MYTNDGYAQRFSFPLQRKFRSHNRYPKMIVQTSPKVNQNLQLAS